MTTPADPFRIWFRLLRLETRIRMAMTERLRAIGISVPQTDVLSTLTEREGVSQQELAERLYVTKGNISGLIDRLVASGLVERRPIVGDRRSHAIYLTEDGRVVALKGIAIQRAFVTESLGRMSVEDLAGFEAMLTQARDHVRQAAGAPASARKRSSKADKPEISSIT